MNIERDRLAALIHELNYNAFMDETLDDSEEYEAEEYPEFLADQIIKKFKAGELS